MNRHEQPIISTAVTEPFKSAHHCQDVESSSPILLRDRKAKNAKPSAFTPALAVELLLPVQISNRKVKPFARESDHFIPDSYLLVRPRKIQSKSFRINIFSTLDTGAAAAPGIGASRPDYTRQASNGPPRLVNRPRTGVGSKTDYDGLNLSSPKILGSLAASVSSRDFLTFSTFWTPGALGPLGRGVDLQLAPS